MSFTKLCAGFTSATCPARSTVCRSAVALLLTASVGIPIASAATAGSDVEVDHAAVYFEPNRGQAAAPVQFLARSQHSLLLLSGTEAIFAQPPAHPDGEAASPARACPQVRMQLVGATEAQPAGQRPTGGNSHYFVGADPANWQSNVPHFARLHYSQVYPGIDLVYHAERGQLEYDFVLAPGADPNLIALSFSGDTGVRIAKDGALHVSRACGQPIRHQAPVVWQELDGERQPVAGRFAMQEDGTVRFALAQHDRLATLTIDPVLEFASYLGGAAVDNAGDIGVDDAGFMYVAGVTPSVDFPVSGAFQGSKAGGVDLTVTKINPATGAVVYSTYFGGFSNEFVPIRLAVSATGEAAFAAVTTSQDIPQVNAFQPKPLTAATLASGTTFVARLSADGSALVHSSYLGGGLTLAGGLGGAFEEVRGMEIDAQGDLYIAGSTTWTDFPATQTLNGRPCLGTGAPAPQDGYVAKISAAGVLEFAVCVGGNAQSTGRGIAVDDSGQIYLVGWTTATDFPLVNPLQGTLRGGRDAYITKLDATASSVLYSTLLGGPSFNDFIQDIKIDSTGAMIVGGQTTSAFFPVVNADRASYGGPPGTFEGFVSKLTAAGNALVFSTFVGGTIDAGFGDEVWSIGLDAADNIYAVGQTGASDFATLDAVQASKGGRSDLIALRFTPAGVRDFSTFLGGAGFETTQPRAVTNGNGDIFIAGWTQSADAPLVNPIQAVLPGQQSYYVAKISMDDAGNGADGNGNDDGNNDSNAAPVETAADLVNDVHDPGGRMIR